MEVSAACAEGGEVSEREGWKAMANLLLRPETHAPAAHPPEGSPAWPYWVTCERQGHAGRAHYYTAGCQNPQHAPTPPPGPGQDGRHLPTHAVMWLVVNERICRKQHAPTEPHEWERATFSPAPEGE
jgi:hypothetical protein